MDRVMEVRALCRGGMGYATVGPQQGVIVSLWGIGAPWDRNYFLSPAGVPNANGTGVTEGGEVTAVA